jgi:hypothetical protein
LHDTSSREFKVTAQLSKFPTATEHIRGDFAEKDGSSYLLAPESAMFLALRCPEGVFDLKKNEIGEISLIELACTATSTKEARAIFLKGVLPFVDHLVFLTNSPLFIASLRVEDLKNHRTALDFISPYRSATVNPHEGEAFLELGPVYAMYREAKNSTSDFYKFLCYYKILEGLLGNLRANAFTRAKASGKQPPKPKDIVPNADELPEQFKPYVGKSVKVFFDAILTPQFRNAVAHFVTDERHVLNMSDPQHIDRYAEILYICELCTRVVITSHEEILKSLAK